MEWSRMDSSHRLLNCSCLNQMSYYFTSLFSYSYSAILSDSFYKFWLLSKYMILCLWRMHSTIISFSKYDFPPFARPTISTILLDTMLHPTYPPSDPFLHHLWNMGCRGIVTLGRGVKGLVIYFWIVARYSWTMSLWLLVVLATLSMLSC